MMRFRSSWPRLGLEFDMANLTTNDKQILEKLFQMGSGYVLNFSDRTIQEFFRDDLGIDIYTKKYEYGSGSKANRMRGFWTVADDKMVAKSIIKLLAYIDNEILLSSLSEGDFPEKLINAARMIAEKLGGKIISQSSGSEATYKEGVISIKLQKEVFSHVEKLLHDGHYFTAVEESYKIVRKKLREITGKEKATDAFAATNYPKIFGRQPTNDAEKDFFEGVKFLHMAIQMLRNEKSHTLAYEMDQNLALHYISLASLSYDLISKKV